MRRLVVLSGAALLLVTALHENTRGVLRGWKMTVSMATTGTIVMVAIIRIHIIESETPAICLVKIAINDRRKDQKERRGRNTDTVMRTTLLSTQRTLTNTQCSNWPTYYILYVHAF